ncbi:MAG TPA: hypothetical protein VG184_07490, partial [Acidimicrobiales bacterium]|nr:hypothetical protein [Acidimicrobiales bacterium]
MAEAGGDGQTVTSLLEHAEAKRRAGLLAEARAGYMEAARTAEAGGHPSSFVTAALGVGGIWVHEHRDVVARVAVDSVWQRARSLAPSGSVEEARLAVRQAA